MRLSGRRIRAIVRKELRDYRRNRTVLLTMTIFPLIFLIQPLIAITRVNASSIASLRDVHPLLYMLAIPVLTPATVAASAIAGERQQGSLEPILTTPIPREELLIGKGVAALIPSIGIAYLVYALFIPAALVMAKPGVAEAMLHGPDVLAQLVFTPLLGLWSIWVGLAISTRSTDIRTAQQLSLLGSLPVVALTSLVAFDIIHPTVELALGAGFLLLVVDALGWRIVAPLFDRERLITGTR